MATSIASPSIFVGKAEIFSPASSLIAEPAAQSVAVAQLSIAVNPASSNDYLRTWFWWFLAVVAASQLYFFRELFAAFAIFAVIFAALAFLMVALYMLVKCGEQAMACLARLRQPAVQLHRLAGDSHKPA